MSKSLVMLLLAVLAVLFVLPSAQASTGIDISLLSEGELLTNGIQELALGNDVAPAPKKDETVVILTTQLDAGAPENPRKQGRDVDITYVKGPAPQVKPLKKARIIPTKPAGKKVPAIIVDNLKARKLIPASVSSTLISDCTGANCQTKPKIVQHKITVATFPVGVNGQHTVHVSHSVESAIHATTSTINATPEEFAAATQGGAMKGSGETAVVVQVKPSSNNNVEAKPKTIQKNGVELTNAKLVAVKIVGGPQDASALGLKPVKVINKDGSYYKDVVVPSSAITSAETSIQFVKNISKKTSSPAAFLEISEDVNSQGPAFNGATVVYSDRIPRASSVQNLPVIVEGISGKFSPVEANVQRVTPKIVVHLNHDSAPVKGFTEPQYTVAATVNGKPVKVNNKTVTASVSTQTGKTNVIVVSKNNQSSKKTWFEAQYNDGKKKSSKRNLVEARVGKVAKKGKVVGWHKVQYKDDTVEKKSSSVKIVKKLPEQKSKPKPTNFKPFKVAMLQSAVKTKGKGKAKSPTVKLIAPKIKDAKKPLPADVRSKLESQAVDSKIAQKLTVAADKLLDKKPAKAQAQDVEKIIANINKLVSSFVLLETSETKSTESADADADANSNSAAMVEKSEAQLDAEADADLDADLDTAPTTKKDGETQGLQKVASSLKQEADSVDAKIKDLEEAKANVSILDKRNGPPGRLPTSKGRTMSQEGIHAIDAHKQAASFKQRMRNGEHLGREVSRYYEMDPQAKEKPTFVKPAGAVLSKVARIRTKKEDLDAATRSIDAMKLAVKETAANAPAGQPSLEAKAAGASAAAMARAVSESVDKKGRFVFDLDNSLKEAVASSQRVVQEQLKKEEQFLKSRGNNKSNPAAEMKQIMDAPVPGPGAVNRKNEPSAAQVAAAIASDTPVATASGKAADKVAEELDQKAVKAEEKVPRDAALFKQAERLKADSEDSED